MTPILATFDGADRQFQIRGEHVPYFEQALGGSLFAILKRLTDGVWTFDLIARVVSFALHGPDAEMRRMIEYSKMSARFGGMSIPITYRAHPDVASVLQRDGHGNFADLASRILSAAIFGDDADAA